MAKGQDKRTVGFDPCKLSDLLRLARPQDDGPPAATDDEQMSQALEEMLCEPLRLSASAARVLPGIPPMLTHVLEFCEEKPVGQILFGSDVDLNPLRRIKEHYRERSRTAPSGRQRAAAVAVYYAAIAAAWVRHHVSISSYSPRELLEAFDKLGTKPWISDRLKGLYRKAAQCCAEQAKKGVAGP